MASTTVIASATAAADSSAITLVDGQSISVYCVPKLIDAERVRLERSYDGGTTWVSVGDEEYSGTVLTKSVQSQTINGPGVFRLRKSATTSATVVYYD